jgi:hypothetical protein
MVSKKKKAGKARKAAKEAKKAAELEEKEELSVAMFNQERSLEAQMQRLIIGNLMRESNKCRHGVELESHDEKLCREVLAVFEGAYNTCFDNGEDNLASMLQAGVDAACDRFAVVMSDLAKIEDFVSIYVADAVQGILDGNNKAAQLGASKASYFEKSLAIFRKGKEKQVVSTGSMVMDIAELQNGDMKTVVSFLRKRIPCSCLDKKYEEVKYVTKMGMCANPQCSLPDRKVERKKMLTCTGCSNTYYCSYECQKIDWPAHKFECAR